MAEAPRATGGILSPMLLRMSQQQQYPTLDAQPPAAPMFIQRPGQLSSWRVYAWGVTAPYNRQQTDHVIQAKVTEAEADHPPKLQVSSTAETQSTELEEPLRANQTPQAKDATLVADGQLKNETHGNSSSAAESFVDAQGQRFIVEYRAVAGPQPGTWVWLHASGSNRNQVFRDSNHAQVIYAIGHIHRSPSGNAFVYYARNRTVYEIGDGFVVQIGDELISLVSAQASSTQTDSDDAGASWLPEPLQWVWGVLEGDFNEDLSTSQLVVRTLITLIPGINQAADIQDVTAALYKLAWQQRYDEFGPWFDLLVTAIGLFPTAGSALKGVFKWLKQSVGNIDLSALRRLLEPVGINLDQFIRNIPDYIDQATVSGRQFITDLVNKITETASTLRGYTRLDPTGKLDQFIAKLDEFKQALNEILTQIDEKFQEIGRDIQQQLDELLGGNGQLATANGAPIPDQSPDVDQSPMRIEGGRGGGDGLNWSWNSTKTFGHTFSVHGAGARNTNRLRGRAASTQQPQGQWLDNESAADFLRQIYDTLSGSETVTIPDGLGQVILPDGSIVSTDLAIVIPKSTGGYRTAYPTLN